MPEESGHQDPACLRAPLTQLCHCTHTVKNVITGGRGSPDQDEQVMRLLTVNIWRHTEK